MIAILLFRVSMDEKQSDQIFKFILDFSNLIFC